MWMKLKGIRRTGYDSHTDYQSMTGIQNHREKEVMDIQVTHLGTASTHNLAQSIIIMCCGLQSSSYKFIYIYCTEKQKWCTV
jgi:hypothetical protein